jgi:hypothetical protein
MRALPVLALALACAIPRPPTAPAPHLDALRPADVSDARPSLGVLPFVDGRPAASRQAETPELRFAAWGFEREGEEQTGDERFSEPLAEAARRDAIATLLRSGAFSRVEPLAEAADAKDFDLLLAGTLEEMVGTRFRSTSLDLLRLGWYRSRVEDPVGIARLHVRLFRGAEPVWEERIETWRKVEGESIERAALDAMAITNEKLAHQLYRELVSSSPETRDVSLRVLDGCALGTKTVSRHLRDAGEILEREAELRLVARIETWSPPPLENAAALLEHVRGLDTAPGAVLIAFVPLAEPRGLARQLGEHAIVTCRPDEPVEPTTVAHEIAHLFGAVHVRDRASLLNTSDDFEARFLDPLNRRVLRETRTRAFGEPLPAATRGRLEALYRSAPPNVVRPVDLDRALLALRPR